MTATEAIKNAEAKAKREAIIARLLDWINKAQSVEIVRETPTMKQESSHQMAPMLPTGELTIELRLTGIPELDALVIEERCETNKYKAVWGVR